MNASTIWGSGPAWISRARSWIGESARLRRDADELSSMSSRELRDIGVSHIAAVRSGTTITACGPVAHGSWILAQPRSLRRDLRNR